MTQTPTHRTTHYSILLCLLFVAVTLRLHQIAKPEYTGDEAFTILTWAPQPITALLTKIAAIDPQPPATLLTLSAWVKLAGHTEPLTRYFSTLASLIATCTIYQIVRTHQSNRNALITCLLCTINPFQIWYAQDFRPYAFWTATSALSTFTFLVALSTPASKFRWAIHTIIASLALYTFYFEIFFILARNIYPLFSRSHNRNITISHWIGSQIAVAALFTPWALLFLPNAIHYAPTASSAPDLATSLLTFLFGEQAPTHVPLLQLIHANSNLFLLVAFVIMLGAIYSLKQTTAKLLPLITVLVTFIFLFSLTATTNRGYFRARYLAPNAAYILATIVPSVIPLRAPNSHRHNTLQLLSTLSLIIPFLITLNRYYHDPALAKAPSWRSLSTTLLSQTSSRDLVILNYPDPAFTYYYRARATWTTLPTAANLSPTETTQQLPTITAPFDYIWFIPTDSQYFDTTHTVSSWLIANMQPISDQQIGTLRLQQFAPWTPNIATIPHPLSIRLSSLTTLLGYRTTPNTTTFSQNQPTSLAIELFWLPNQTTTTKLTIFLHLLDTTNPNQPTLITQDDHPPQHDRISTTNWAINVPFRDTYHLNLPSLPPGQYPITVGFYNPITLQRLTLVSSLNQLEPNAIALFTIDITPNQQPPNSAFINPQQPISTTPNTQFLDEQKPSW